VILFSYRIDEHTELRLLEPHHSEQLFGLVTANHSHISEWMFWLGEDYSIEDARRHIRKALERFANSDGFEAGIWQNGGLAGCIRINYIDWKHKSTEIGYWVGASFQGQGLATKACRAVIEYAFAELMINRVEIRCIDENERSRAIPERLGFTVEGVIRQARWRKDHYVDLVVYGMLAHEWAANRTGEEARR
jgi:ribosomal-protein-serine acetyltransferase